MTSIAVINAGSSSIKLAVYDRAMHPTLLLRGQIEGLGTRPRARLSDAHGKVLSEESFSDSNFDHDQATRALVRIGNQWLGERSISAVGHRVVHGGPDYTAPLLVSESVIEKLESFIPLAPLHQPHNLTPIRTILALRPELPQVACFDTSFHRGQAPVAQAFAIPRHYSQDGVRRYGFHGISYEYITSRLAEVAPEIARRRLVIAHLGNGASLCAVHEARSVASTMGFTAADGLMMGTRCGSLDPGVMIYLMDRYGLDARGLEDLIYRRSGLLGVSGLSSDMRALRTSKEPAAREAVALFVYRIVREIGSLAAALGGIDAIVFTGGIGENDAATRSEISMGCAWLGLEIDEGRNAAGELEISSPLSRVKALIVPTDEELKIAQATWRITSAA